MLSAEKIFKDLEERGIKVTSYEESRKPKYVDGEVILKNSLSVQVGPDYVCLCYLGEKDIEYLLEMEDVYNETDCASEIAKFLETRIN